MTIDVATGTPRGVSNHVDLASMRKLLFAKRIPRAEEQRNYYGRTIDLNHIEKAMLHAGNGMMVGLTDLESESIGMDPHVLCVATKRFGAVASLPWRLTPAKGPGIDKARSQQIYEVVQEHIRGMRGFRNGLYDLAWSLFDGRGSNELEWVPTFGKTPWRPVAWHWLHPRRLSYGQDRELRLIEATRDGGFRGPGHAFDDYPGKFVQWLPRRFREYPEREGLGPRTMYWSLFKRFSWRMRMILTELFAIPWRIVEIDKDAPVQAQDIDDAAESADSLGGETSAVFAPGMHIRVEKGNPESGPLFSMSSDQCDGQMSKLYLGNTGTTDAMMSGLNSNQAGVHEGQQNIYVSSDAGSMSERIQEDLVDIDVLVNFGPDWLDHAPHFELDSTPAKDRNAEQDRHTKAISLGVPVALADYYEAGGIRKPEDDEATLVLEPAGPMGGAPRARIVEPARRTLDAEIAADPMADIASDDEAEAEDDAEAPEDDAPAPDTAPPAPQGKAAQALAALLNERSPHLCARQPSTVNGSPESIIERGVREGARLTGAWAERIAAATEGADTGPKLHQRVKVAAAELDLDKLSASLERTIVRSLMLGALDADWEAKADQPIAIPAFAEAAREGVLTFDSHLAPKGVKAFATKPFAEAIRDFSSRKVMSKKQFDRLRADAKKRAFTIAGLARGAMLQTAFDEIKSAITEGRDLFSFRKNLGERFESAGWTPVNKSHAETVFRNATMSSYSAGRDAQMTQPAVLAARPYWQIMGVRDDRARETHAKALGKVLRADDPFWKKASPPFGFNCRCRKISRSPADLERLGLTVSSGADLAGLPDEGWSGDSVL